MSDLILFWHRRDLRISDNIGLSNARAKTPRVVGIFCLDPHILERDDVAPARVTYLLGCLQDLQQRYQQAGSQLLILHQPPEQGIPQLAETLKAQAVFWNLDVEPYARKRDQTVTQNLREKGIETVTFWDQLLHAPEEVLTGKKEVYKVYTPYWRKWYSLPKADPVTALESGEGLTELELDAAKKIGIIDLPSAKDLGFNWEKELLLQPGEQAALNQLDVFCETAIKDYAEQRNFPANLNGTSKLSAALKFGVIGIRTVWHKITHLSLNLDNPLQSIETWQQELAWREFYQQVMYHFPELAQGAYRQELKDFPWENNPEQFQAWCEGKTGYPIVDAAMRQMQETGWMHNRCRMIVASFLTKDLIINWQEGEKYFMQNLYDGDLSANNGGWQWSASSGMDTKPLRIFNPTSQAEKFDPKAEYIRRWIPELQSVETKELLSGEIPSAIRKNYGYPEPIVDHRVQQRLFKERYQQQKLKVGVAQD